MQSSGDLDLATDFQIAKLILSASGSTRKPLGNQRCAQFHLCELTALGSHSDSTFSLVELCNQISAHTDVQTEM